MIIVIFFLVTPPFIIRSGVKGKVLFGWDREKMKLYSVWAVCASLIMPKHLISKYTSWCWGELLKAILFD